MGVHGWHETLIDKFIIISYWVAWFDRLAWLGDSGLILVVMIEKVGIKHNFY